MPAAVTPIRAEESNRVELGGHSYVIVPQRVGRLKKLLGRQLGDITEIATGEGDLLDVGLEKAHSILGVFIPDLMPLHEFCGYSSESAFNDPEADESDDVGPSFPEIVAAYEVIVAVNRFDLFKHLGKLVSPTLLRSIIQQEVGRTLMTPGTTNGSASSSATPGPDTPSTTSGTPSPTSESSAA